MRRIQQDRDSRKHPGNVVHALLKHVTNETEARRLHGVRYAQRMVNGRVIKCIDARKPGGARANFEIEARYTITSTHKKDVRLNIRSVHAGEAAPGDGTGGDVILPAPPANEIVNYQPLARNIPAGAIVLPADVRRSSASGSASSETSAEVNASRGERGEDNFGMYFAVLCVRFSKKLLRPVFV